MKHYQKLFKRRFRFRISNKKYWSFKLKGKKREAYKFLKKKRLKIQKKNPLLLPFYITDCH